VACDGQGMAPAILEEGRPGHYGLPETPNHRPTFCYTPDSEEDDPESPASPRSLSMQLD